MGGFLLQVPKGPPFKGPQKKKSKAWGCSQSPAVLSKSPKSVLREGVCGVEGWGWCVEGVICLSERGKSFAKRLHLPIFGT